jgi:hypothetical protein
VITCSGRGMWALRCLRYRVNGRMRESFGIWNAFAVSVMQSWQRKRWRTGARHAVGHWSKQRVVLDQSRQVSEPPKWTIAASCCHEGMRSVA